MKTKILSCNKLKYVAPDSKVILMETEGFVATSGNLDDYGDGGELSYLNTPGGDKFLKKA